MLLRTKVRIAGAVVLAVVVLAALASAAGILGGVLALGIGLWHGHGALALMGAVMLGIGVFLAWQCVWPGVSIVRELFHAEG